MSARISSGIILAIVVSSALIFLPAWAIKLMMVVVAFIAALEAGAMLLSKSSLAPRIFCACLSSALAATLCFYTEKYHLIIVVFALILMLILVLALVSRLEVALAAQRAMAMLFIVFYTGILIAFLGLLRDLPQGRAWLFFTLGATFASDTGGFVVGRYFGRHKLAPRLSPGKSWEGFGGGILFSITLSLLFKFLFFKDFSIENAICISLIASLCGPWGDLSESLLKRAAGVKDSGHLIPGHGGILDRIDALLFTAPLMYAYALSVVLT